MRRLLLHVGFNKTGSTSIQHFLAESDEELNSGGWAYARSGDEGRPNRGHYRGLVRVGKRNGNIEASLRFDRFMAATNESSEHNLVLSSEMLSWIRDLDQLGQLAAALDQQFSEVTIVVYVRRQDELAISHSQQAAKQRRSGLLSPAHLLYESRPEPLPPATVLTRSYLDFASAIHTWESAFGRDAVRVLPCDDQTDVVHSFSEVLGISPSDRPIRENARMDARRDLFNRILATADCPWWLNRAASTIEVELAGEALVPSAEEARSFVQEFAQANEKLAARSLDPVTFSTTYDYPSESNLSTHVPSALDSVADFLNAQALVPGLTPEMQTELAEVQQRVDVISAGL